MFFCPPLLLVQGSDSGLLNHPETTVMVHKVESNLITFVQRVF